MDFNVFYRELYFKENERRQEVLNALNIPIAIITALATAIYLFITTYDYSLSVILNYFFVDFVLLSTISLILAIFYLVKAFCDFYKGYEYKGLPYPGELHKWHNDLKSYYQQYQLNDDSDNTLENTILEKLLSCTDHNMYVNDKKHEYIYNSKKFLVGSLICSLLTFLPFGYNYFNKGETTCKIIESSQQGLKINCKK
jgi:hypothetical protein